MGGNHNLSPDIGKKLITDSFIKCYDGCIFLYDKNLPIFLSLNPAIYRTGNVPNILCPRCKEKDETHSNPLPPFYLLLQDFQN